MGLQIVRDCGSQKIKAAVYSRVSTVGHGQDPAMQTRELREYCHRRGWDIFDCYEDSVNDAFRKQAALGLRQFVERFVKDLYSSETGQSVSKRFENTSWPELRNLLRQCKKFEPADEAILEDTHEFASPYLHTDDSRPQTVPSPSHLNPHHTAMNKLYEKYVAVFNLT